MQEKIEVLQQMTGEKLRVNEPLLGFTTLKIGGTADIFYDAKTVEKLVDVVKAARFLEIPVTIIGGGSNILIADGGIRGLVIKNNTGAITIAGMKGKVEAGAAKGRVFVEADTGVVFNKLVRFTLEEGLGGLEAHLGLPGTVGGAIYMNSKWTSPMSYVGDAVYQAMILTPQGVVKTVDRSYFRFAYDTSIIQKTRDIVLRVVFALAQSGKEELWAIANQSILHRRGSQPQGVRSAGCTFRNLSQAQAITAATPNYTVSAGFLIDRAGLKGKTIGDAQISPVHANFIVNNGHAKAADVVELIEIARSTVKEQFGVELEEEIVRMGEF